MSREWEGDTLVKVGDVIQRKQELKNLKRGIIIDFDKDSDPIILWSSGIIEEEYSRSVEVIIDQKASKR
jgi:hypothetical protein